MDLFNFFDMFDDFSKITIYNVDDNVDDDEDTDEDAPVFCGYINDIPLSIIRNYRLVTPQECRDEGIESVCGVYSNDFIIRVKYNQ